MVMGDDLRSKYHLYRVLYTCSVASYVWNVAIFDFADYFVLLINNLNAVHVQKKNKPLLCMLTVFQGSSVMLNFVHMRTTMLILNFIKGEEYLARILYLADHYSHSTHAKLLR